MKNVHLLAIACLASTAVAAAGPFEQLKGKMKEGMYEYKMEMDMGQMPGMPPGMGKQSNTFTRCVTAQDIEKGEMGRAPRDRQNNCEFKNVNVSGNTATYTMECKGERPMRADNRMTFTSDGYKMDMKMQMEQGGQAMNMTQHMEARYLGPCK